MNTIEYNQWLHTKNLAKKTIHEYTRYIEQLPELTQPAIIQFLAHTNNPVSRAAIKNLIEHQTITTGNNPNITVPKSTGRKKRRIPKVITQEEAHKLADNTHTERDAIIILLAFYGGLRASEIFNIKPYDFYWDAWTKNPDTIGKLKVTGKGDKERIVLLPPDLMRTTYQWILNHVAPHKTPDKKLFGIGRRRWSIILDQISTQTLGRHINPHLLRHSCATWLKDNGWDLKDIAEYLGHDSIVTTQIYAHTSKEKVAEKYSKLPLTF